MSYETTRHPLWNDRQSDEYETCCVCGERVHEDDMIYIHGKHFCGCSWREFRLEYAPRTASEITNVLYYKARSKYHTGNLVEDAYIKAKRRSKSLRKAMNRIMYESIWN